MHSRQPTKLWFSLVYCTDAIILVEVGEQTLHQEHYNEDLNEDGNSTNLDLLVERREKAHIQDMRPRLEWPKDTTQNYTLDLSTKGTFLADGQPSEKA